MRLEGGGWFCKGIRPALIGLAREQEYSVIRDDGGERAVSGDVESGRLIAEGNEAVQRGVYFGPADPVGS